MSLRPRQLWLKKSESTDYITIQCLGDAKRYGMYMEMAIFPAKVNESLVREFYANITDNIDNANSLPINKFTLEEQSLPSHLPMLLPT